MEFAEKIRKLLKERRLTQTDLAESLGTNQQQVSRWLDANQPPKVAYLLKLARALEVTVDYLVDDAQEQPAGAHGMNPDETYVIRAVRGLGLTYEEAIRRLAGEPGGVAREAGGLAPTISEREISESGKRDEKHKRLGFELETDTDGPGTQDVPPGRRKR